MYKSLPQSPGIYIFKNKENKIIYVGKAINLKKRVSQYFQRDDALGPKTQTLVSQIAKIDFQVVGSEIEALVLESSLIKKYKPKYNSKLTDDKSYVYICITKDKLPIIFTAYRSQIPENCFIYGPFPSGPSVRMLLRSIRKIFPFYTKTNHSKNKCLYCHLNLCPGPNPDPKKYNRNIGKIKKILSGNIKSLETQLKKEMKIFSKSEDYESAIMARNQLSSLNYIVSGWKNINNLFEKVNFQQDEASSALNEIKTLLKSYFPKVTEINRIECFDISNLGSKYFVGAMSVFENGILAKNEYRKFKIYSKITPDDQFMIKEIIYRRLKHSEWNFPQIILVDGGKPQISAALDALKKFNELYKLDELEKLDKLILGLAKKQETVIFKNADKWVEVNLPKNSNALKLFQLVRDEAHRFANRYRKELIKNNLKLI